MSIEITGRNYHQVEIQGHLYDVEPFWRSSADGPLPLSVEVSDSGNPDGYTLQRVQQPNAGYQIIDSYWYTPTFPGTDPAEHVMMGLPSVTVGFVAIESRPGHWKCYMGWVPESDDQDRDEQLIARNGTKVSKEVACAHFPLPPEEFES